MGCKSMPFATSGKGKCRFLSVSGDAVIDTVSELQQEIITASKKDVNYLVDLSGVESCDAAGLQLIFSLFSHLTERGSLFKVEECSPCVEELLNVTGMIFPESTLIIEE